MNLSGDALYAITLAIWIAVTVLAFVGGAWLWSRLRDEDDLMLADQLARKQIGVDEYRAKATLIQP